MNASAYWARQLVSSQSRTRDDNMSSPTSDTAVVAVGMMVVVAVAAVAAVGTCEVNVAFLFFGSRLHVVCTHTTSIP